jgi:hypothetical protein
MPPKKDVGGKKPTAAKIAEDKARFAQHSIHKFMRIPQLTELLLQTFGMKNV